MAKKTKTKQEANHPVLRTLVLAGCIIILMIFLVNVLLNLFTRHNQYYIVPDLAGMSMEKAQELSANANLQLEVVDSLYVPLYNGGVILEQRPEHGAKVKSGRRVFLTVNSYNQRRVKVPFVAGFSLRQAKNNLELSGLVIDELIYRDDLATNNVLEQYYGDQKITMETNLELQYGSAITLIVGKGNDAMLQNMPKLIGLTSKEAKSRLWELGLNIGKVRMDEGVNLLNQHDARVYAQGIDHALSVSLGSRVDLALSFDDDLVSKASYSADSSYKQRLAQEKLLQEQMDSIEMLSLTELDSLSSDSSTQVEDDIMEGLMNMFN